MSTGPLPKGDTVVLESGIWLDAEPDAVPRARRLVAAEMAGTALESLVPDVELVVTELATNALMYAGPPVLVRLKTQRQVVRIEVEDRSRTGPVRGMPGSETMTGRGLALVSAISRRSGVEFLPGGKLVWAELAAAGVRPDHLDASGDVAVELTEGDRADLRSDQASHSQRFTISLSDVPTDLLIAAKSHVDNIVREFTLLAAGAVAGQTAPVPPHLATLIETVTSRFAAARQAIKHQALAAAAAGEDRTRLLLTLPLSAADAGEEYLAALDEADSYARAARLLTLETPPQHRTFRRWYVHSLVSQLRRVARGERPEPMPTFEQHLLGELGVITAAQRAADRIARLQAVTASLAGATTPEEVAQVVVSEGVAALGASGGGLLVPVNGQRLAVPGTVGYEEALVHQLRAERRDAELPAATAMRTGEPVWLESRQERDARFPALTGLEPGTVAMCAVPLIVSGRVLGALRFSFDAPRLFDADERRFVLALAAQTAQAFERSDLYAGERRARAAAELVASRLARLQQVTESLAFASDSEQVADIVVTEAAEAVGATLAALCMQVDDHTLRLVRIRGASPGVEERWQTFPIAANLPASEAFRTRKPVIIADRAELVGRFPALAGQVRTPQHALVCLPLIVADRCVGALSLSFPQDHAVNDDEVQLLMTIGRQCALALERTRLFAAERAARDRTIFLSDATELLTSSLEPAKTLEHLTGLVVPALADCAVVYLSDENGVPQPTAVAHRQPAAAARIRAALMDRQLDIDGPDGLGDVFRTRRSARYPGVPNEIRSQALGGAAARDNDLAQALAAQSAMAVALTGHDRVVGAIVLARVTGEPYTEEDVRLVEAVAARAAVAVDNARQFDREREAALTLQRSLLPQQLPRVPGVKFAWRYLPGAAGTHIGGDWYDVIPLEHGQVALVIGDVMGRGLQAAAIMGQLRATARAYASVQLGPAEVLKQLDRAVARLEQAQITTAAFGVLDPARRSLTIASAGHLPPLVTAPPGDAYYLDLEPGPPLGASHAEYPELTVALPEKATMLLFTDGLVEDRSRPVDDGMTALRLAARGVADPELLCDRALAALGRDSEHDDDTAMLAVALCPTAR